MILRTNSSSTNLYLHFYTLIKFDFVKRQTGWGEGLVTVIAYKVIYGGVCVWGGTRQSL